MFNMYVTIYICLRLYNNRYVYTIHVRYIDHSYGYVYVKYIHGFIKSCSHKLVEMWRCGHMTKIYIYRAYQMHVT